VSAIGNDSIIQLAIEKNNKKKHYVIFFLKMAYIILISSVKQFEKIFRDDTRGDFQTILVSQV